MSAPPHFLLVSYPAQGHITPARHLALRLLRATGAHVTVCTAISAHRRMFPDTSEVEEHIDDAGVHYVPYSDGSEETTTVQLDHSKYIAQLRVEGPPALAAVLARLRDSGRPVTRLVYTVLLSWAVGVARDHGIPSVLYWIQSATVLASYFHVLRGTHGVDKAIAAAATDSMAPIQVPGIPAPLVMRDLPSFLLATDASSSEEEDPYAIVLTAFRELLGTLDAQKGGGPTSVLANTFDAMEPEAVATLRQHGLDVVPIGPVLSFLDTNNKNDLFEQDGRDYMAWLDAQEAGSVVYISFGSMSVMSARQIAEVERGMADSGRPFLWVLRKDNRRLDLDGAIDAGGAGIVVEWCDQGKVLSHPAVGCFVTHCGWNSTVESLACGVPIVGVPQWSDQGTNAWLMEQLGTGVRAAMDDKADDDGVLMAAELRRCLGLAMSETVRAKAQLWRDKARAAVLHGGSSDLNLRASFVALTN